MAHDLTAAVSHANTVLNWQENLPEDEMPPDWMWHLDEELEHWFEDVKARRKERYGGASDDEPETVPMMSNALAKDRK